MVLERVRCTQVQVRCVKFYLWCDPCYTLHKCTQNLFDLTSLWKKTVLTRLERDVLEPEENLGSEMDISLSDLSETDPGYLF
jgi:hypothetical protein